MVHLGRNISRLRNFRGMKQSEMAKRLNMTQQNYSHIENSENIDEPILTKIAEIIEFPVELIKQFDTAVQSINNSGSITESIFYQNNPVEKIIDLYEKLLKDKEEIIKQKNITIELLTKEK